MKYSSMQISINTAIFCGCYLVKRGAVKVFFHRSFGLVYLLLPNKEREWVRLPTLETMASPPPCSRKKSDCQKDGEAMSYF